MASSRAVITLLLIAGAFCLVAAHSASAAAARSTAHPPQDTDAKAIAIAKRVSVRRLDASLPATPFTDWLDRLVGATARRTWEVNDCGEQAGVPGLDRDYPSCVEVDVELSSGRRLVVSMFVGTVKRGLTPDAVAIYDVAVIDADRAVKSLRKLSELPGAIGVPK